MKLRLLLFAVSMTVSLFIINDQAQANKKCLSISYSLTSFHKGDLDRTCKEQIKSAQDNGFTTITLIPAIEYDPNTNKIFPLTNTMKKGELTRCLNLIWDSGMGFVYQPHLDSTRTLRGTREAPGEWRAHFYFDPTDTQYFNSMFEEFEEFLENKKLEISKRTKQFDVVIAAELETSTTKLPAEWLKFTRDMRKRHLKMGVQKKVRIGFNPNWRPMVKIENRRNCLEFRSFVREFDFVAPSFYGDWSKLTHPCSTWHDVENRKSEVLGLLSRKGRTCEVSEFYDLPFAVGEFGTGPRFHVSSYDYLLEDSTRDSYSVKRRKLYQNLIEWAANTSSNHNFKALTSPLALNIWTIGVFDPVNASKSQNSLSDGSIKGMFQYYKKKACSKPLKIYNLEGIWKYDSFEIDGKRLWDVSRIPEWYGAAVYRPGIKDKTYSFTGVSSSTAKSYPNIAFIKGELLRGEKISAKIWQYWPGKGQGRILCNQKYAGWKQLSDGKLSKSNEMILKLEEPDCEGVYDSDGNLLDVKQTEIQFVEIIMKSKCVENKKYDTTNYFEWIDSFFLR